MVFEVAESGEDDDYYTVTLSVRPQGNFNGTSGQEQFVIGKEGTIAVRQVLSDPVRKSGGFPLLLVVIGLVVIGIIAVVGAMFAISSSGGGSVQIAQTSTSGLTSAVVFLSKWGTGTGEFNQPVGVAMVSDGSVYVADTGNNRIQKFSVGQ